MNIHLKDAADVADLGFIAYFGKTSPGEVPQKRPIAFCFNGGPGSSSVWLHMGFLGPKIVEINDLSPPSLPVGYKDNQNTLLNLCDLVFIDPVSTGFSSATNRDKTKNFYGVEEDVLSIADFIRLFLTKFNRWDSPKLLIGESYGTFRAVGLSHMLQDRYFIDINGLILLSLVLDLQPLDTSHSLDIPCITNLPTYAAIAKYHNTLSPDLAQLSVPQIIEKAKEFSINTYAPALIQGCNLSDSNKENISLELQRFTSLSKETLSSVNLRITPEFFMTEVLKPKGQVIGRYDGRSTTFKVPDELSAWYNPMDYPDPSFYQISGAFSAAFHTYLLQDLHWEKEEPYILLNFEVHPWNWTVHSRPSAGLGYVSLLQDFRLAIAKNPNLKTFVAAGYYDLATPYFSQEYSLTHLDLPKQIQNNITIKGYEAGHMMYLNPPSRKALRDDIGVFISSMVSP